MGFALRNRMAGTAFWMKELMLLVIIIQQQGFKCGREGKEKLLDEYTGYYVWLSKIYFKMHINFGNSATTNFSPLNFQHSSLSAFQLTEGQSPKPKEKAQTQNASLVRPALELIHSEKQSAQNSEDENLTDQFDDAYVQQLKTSLEKLEYFMEDLGRLKNSIIQEQILSHISSKVHKFEKLNFRMVHNYAHDRVKKIQRNRKIKKNWSDEDIKILVWVVAKYCEWKQIKDVYYGIDEFDWKFISAVIPGSKSSRCMFKWLGLRKCKIRDQKWEEEEKNQLKELVKEYGENSWGTIAKKLFYRNNYTNRIYRSGKQCREHWNCFLSPNLKRGHWTFEEDNKLVEMVLKEDGKKKWSRLVTFFEGRTENSIKNRYSILLQKERNLHKLPKKAEDKAILKKYQERVNLSDPQIMEELKIPEIPQPKLTPDRAQKKKAEEDTRMQKAQVKIQQQVDLNQLLKKIANSNSGLPWKAVKGKKEISTIINDSLK